MLLVCSKILEGSGYHLPQNSNLTSITKGKAVNALGNVVIVSSETTCLTKLKWTLKNAFITNVDWGELNYESDDLTNVTLTIRYDWAECRTDFTGVDRSAGQDRFFGQRASDDTAASIEDDSQG